MKTSQPQPPLMAQGQRTKVNGAMVSVVETANPPFGHVPKGARLTNRASVCAVESGVNEVDILLKRSRVPS